MNRSFINLKIGFGSDFVADRFVDHREHLSEPVHPIAYRLPTDLFTILFWRRDLTGRLQT
jgi:hypothetical protein